MESQSVFTFGNSFSSPHECKFTRNRNNVHVRRRRRASRRGVHHHFLSACVTDKVRVREMSQKRSSRHAFVYVPTLIMFESDQSGYSLPLNCHSRTYTPWPVHRNHIIVVVQKCRWNTSRLKCVAIKSDLLFRPINCSSRERAIF